MRAALRSSSPMTTATDTTMVPSGIPRRSALPVSLDRHVSGGSAAMATSLAALTSQEAVLRAADVQA